MSTTFLSVSLKVHQPSLRKRNAMLKTMRMATAARAALYSLSEEQFNDLITNPGQMGKSQRKREVDSILGRLVKDKSSFGANGHLLGTAIRDSVLLDVKALMLSRLALLSNHDEMAGAAGLLPVESQLNVGLDALAGSISKQEEDVARDLLAIKARDALRPVRFVRWRISDGFMILAHGEKWFAWLPIGGQRVAAKEKMIDIRSGEEVSLSRSTGILLPLKFGRYQENLIRNGTPRSAILKYSAESNEFALNVAIEFQNEDLHASDAVIGIDRGIEVVAAYAVRKKEQILSTGMVDGSVLRDVQRKHEALLKEAQRRGSRIRFKWKKYVDQLVHETANKIVEEAKRHRAQVILEDLKNIQNGPQRRKIKFSVRTTGERNLNKQLQRSVYAQLERVLTYKLALRGLPPPKSVHAGGTSITCSACSHKDKTNRPARSEFKCVSCGHEAHADINAAINIAARGQRFLAGGKRLPPEGGVIVLPRAAGDDANAGGCLTPYVSTGAKDATQVQKTAENSVGTESMSANNAGQHNPLTNTVNSL